MKHLLLFMAAFAVCLHLFAQNCANTSVGYPPINDLGTGWWHGAQGGLYPNGSNYRPAAHNQAGFNIANQIQPLDTAGNVNAQNGKVVWLSIGMSNTTQESQVFIPMADTLSAINPKLVLIDGAQGGQDIVTIDDPNASYWSVVNTRLTAAGLTPAQVQIIWFKEAEAGPADTSFLTYPAALKEKYKIALQHVKSKFPNAKLAYLTSRIYAGYATSLLNPEPFAYYSGWSVKQLIEDQINGDPSLVYYGANPRVPWLAWGPYPWADGTTPRSDGLTWICPDDFISDGTHPSTIGRQKVAQLLLDFFTTDSTAMPWFLKQVATVVGHASADVISIAPNPVENTLHITSNVGNSRLEIIDVAGRVVLDKTVAGPASQVDVSSLPNGMYRVLCVDAMHYLSTNFVILR